MLQERGMKQGCVNPTDYPAQPLSFHHFLYVGHSYQTLDPRAQEFPLASPALMLTTLLGSNLCKQVSEGSRLQFKE